MGRLRRFRIAGIPQLVSQRGHNRLPCFTDGEDFRKFEEVLGQSAQQYDCEIQALLMLPDAYWAVLLPSEADSVQRTIQLTGRLFVRYVNQKRRREGTLWAERYSACPVEASAAYLDCVARFLASLPKSQGYGASDSDWPWKRINLPSCDDQSLDPAIVGRALRAGVALGSSFFIEKLEKATGQRAVARARGRPRREPKSQFN